MLTSFNIVNSNNSNILHVIRLQSGNMPSYVPPPVHFLVSEPECK